MSFLFRAISKDLRLRSTVHSLINHQTNISVHLLHYCPDFGRLFGLYLARVWVDVFEPICQITWISCLGGTVAVAIVLEVWERSFNRLKSQDQS